MQMIERSKQLHLHVTDSSINFTILNVVVTLNSRILLTPFALGKKINSRLVIRWESLQYESICYMVIYELESKSELNSFGCLIFFFGCLSLSSIHCRRLLGFFFANWALFKLPAYYRQYEIFLGFFC